MTARNTLPPNIAKALEVLAASPVPLKWDKFALHPRKDGRDFNVMRSLKRRGYVEDTVPTYRPGEPWTGPRVSLYRLSPAGWKALNAHRGEQP